MSATQIIVLVTPLFALLIAAELWWDTRRQRGAYRLADAIGSLNLGLLSQTSAIFTGLLRIGLYAMVFEQVALWRNDAFWTSLPGWLLALVFYDFCYYWLHRMGHEVAVLWAAHAVHHQSQYYNLTTALRQTSSGALLGWVFYLPMALAGVPPLVFAVVGLVDLLYQFWVHTEHVPPLRRFDRWLCSPSNHRVHHAVNDNYLDKNYGGILMVWDRLFGTFKEEDLNEPCVYGTRGLLNSWDPLWANAQVYAALAQDSWRARRWSDKLRVWLKPPGWRPADVAARHPKPPFSMAQMVLFDPPLSRALQGFGCVQFALLLAGAGVFLWRADSTPLLHNALWFGVLLASQWTLGAALQGRIGMLEALMVQTAAIATASSQLKLLQWHYLFKPLPLLIAIVLIALQARPSCAKGQKEFSPVWLMAAAAGSLAGDVFLMLGNTWFIAGLASFLLAHGAYLALFGQGQPRWLAHRGALAATLALGAGIYAFLWHGGLPAGLRAPVAVYVLAIALMAAQAYARAHHLRTPAAWSVATGAGLFMLSDALLATNLFVQALPLAQFAVLSSYFAAQSLIVGGMLRSGPRPSSAAPQSRVSASPGSATA